MESTQGQSRARALADQSDDRPLPIAVTIADAVRLSGISRTVLYEELKQGSIEAVKAGNRTLVLFDSLQHYLADLPRYKSTAERRAAAMGQDCRKPLAGGHPATADGWRRNQRASN